MGIKYLQTQKQTQKQHRKQKKKQTAGSAGQGKYPSLTL